MNISELYNQSLYSVKQALSVITLREAMNQNSSTVASLLGDMKAVNSKIMENSVAPHLGGSIDIRV